ncbi:Predicted pyrophosphatase or phosphodiesterase, AlkP superfamily [Cruoricaptor ignavus]|uniref:Predicted pyrophosphatase or phosphodiesterase, AlkP superfamily n=1 Tax=Cruoricaptor ignavus TaxID=1118202 RepID=A0A1M6DSK7_9FLAO|nr:ectonucleotide pyrophosphatase/phosphodiesterase [Cruoricaptor ignavus]SHI75998.1 Predicted pyrophosphatase or phosphodiesterase, AlkP superfamily [Cruoricaptor ignavus]
MKKLIISLFIIVSSVLSAQSDRYLILITIDGFRPEFYRDQYFPAPTLQWLAKEGASADEVKTIFPSVTYPSHTTIVTGVLPAKHGIYYNTKFDENGQMSGWVYDSKEIKATTIWETLKGKGLTTASVSWPITVGNKFIDYNIPEIWSFENGEDRISASREYSTPAGLFDEAMQNATGHMQIPEFNLSSMVMDQNLSRLSGFIFTKYRPNFMTLHLPIVDGAQHLEGREGDKVRMAVANADSAIGFLLETVRRSGLSEKTDVIITGDHGFVTRKFSVSPNVWLKRNNLYDKAYFVSTGGSVFLYLRNPKDRSTLAKVKDMLAKLPAEERKTFTIIEGKKLTDAMVDPVVSLALTAADGYAFSAAADGDVIKKSEGGTHGYYPDFHNIYTGFIGYGPSFKKGAKAENLSLTDFYDLVQDIFFGTQKVKNDFIIRK